VKALGVVRRIDDLGRVVIPKEARLALGMGPGTPLEILTGDDGSIALRVAPGSEQCALCGSGRGPLLRVGSGVRGLCRPCARAVVAAVREDRR